MISCQGCERTQPEFRFRSATAHMNMRRLPRVAFIGIKKESIVLYTKYHWHVNRASWPFFLNNQYHRRPIPPTEFLFFYSPSSRKTRPGIPLRIINAILQPEVVFREVIREINIVVAVERELCGGKPRAGRRQHVVGHM
ncbi:unknown protein [Cronobacter turicensis z3032]|uniref:Uncharacterized protein n=1 Tax=Cronobacter turicensis (strain DSM 18703 / CCUG 55852 / LMG 23827 / z3032) TaxID=693216 RepID=C9Y0F9_CROTZ|nr:unknown protein [Cronobacter turicensis z3032]